MKMKQIVPPGWEHGEAIGTDGNIYFRGACGIPRLVEGGASNRNPPVRIVDAIIWVSVAVGINYAVAIDKDGSIWAWGATGSDQFDNDILLKTETRIMLEHPDGKKWKAVSAGFNCAAAIDEDDFLWAWGRYALGPKGNIMAATNNMPVKVMHPAGKKWKSVSVEGYHAAVIAEDGSLWAWKSSEENRPMNDRHDPIQIGGDTNWTAVHTYGGHITAQKKDGSIWLGIDFEDHRSMTMPTKESHSMAVRGDGALWTWQNVPPGDSIKPAEITCAIINHIKGKKWKSVSTNGCCTLAIDENGALWIC